jgi:glycosyltransferase involved in cell wall biosynthesis
MKRIIYIIDRPNLYGSELHCLKLIDGFKDEFHFSVIAFDKGPLLSLLEKRGITYKVYNLKWYPNVDLILLYKFIKKNRLDILHCHQPKAIFWGSIIAKILSLKSIITIHSLPSSNAQSYHNYFIKTLVWLFHFFVKLVSEMLTNKVIYLSNFSYASSFFKKKASVIPNWLDETIDEKKIRLSFSKPVRLITIGSVTKNKGMDRMIDALSFIKNENWELKIVGNYEEKFKNKLIKLAESYNISEKINFIGYSNSINKLLLDSDGFILLSRGETFGLVYIEAMNCGLPIISWDIPVIREILPEGNVILNKESDIKKIFIKFYNSQHTYQQVSRNNKIHVDNNFTWEIIKPVYKNIYG